MGADESIACHTANLGSLRAAHVTGLSSPYPHVDGRPNLNVMKVVFSGWLVVIAGGLAYMIAIAFSGR